MYSDIIAIYILSIRCFSLMKQLKKKVKEWLVISFLPLPREIKHIGAGARISSPTKDTSTPSKIILTRVIP